MHPRLVVWHVFLPRSGCFFFLFCCFPFPTPRKQTLTKLREKPAANLRMVKFLLIDTRTAVIDGPTAMHRRCSGKRSHNEGATSPTAAGRLTVIRPLRRGTSKSSEGASCSTSKVLGWKPTTHHMDTVRAGWRKLQRQCSLTVGGRSVIRLLLLWCCFIELLIRLRSFPPTLE